MTESLPATISVNVGVMGHVDSGKTSILRALAREVGGIVSTAGLDKHPQSQERGITIDLGFTSLPLDLQNGFIARVCFVDCPGHASLIRAVMGAAQIVDRIILVIDSSKGMQAQTAECLIIAEILCPYLIVVLNKIDLIPENERTKRVELLTKRLRATVFSKTSFGADVPIIPIAATPGSQSIESNTGFVGLTELLTGLRLSIVNSPPQRNSSGPLYFLFDHAFTKKGYGTIVTGTVVSGFIKVNQEVCVSTRPNETRRVRSIQSFKQSVQTLYQGDRGGVSLTGFDSTDLERGLIINPSSPLPTMHSFIVSLRRVTQFKSTICSNAKYHITIAHTTVVATVHFFTSCQDEDVSHANCPTTDGSQSLPLLPNVFDCSIRYHSLEDLPIFKVSRNQVFYALVEVEHKRNITCPLGSLFIASKLDCDTHCSTPCRLAFYGRLITPLIESNHSQSLVGVRKDSLFVAKEKRKEGRVDRYVDARSVIGDNMFTSKSHAESFIGLHVVLDSVDVTNNPKGVIEKPFGKNGKFCVVFDQNLIGGKEVEGKRLILIYDVNTLDVSKKKYDKINHK